MVAQTINVRHAIDVSSRRRTTAKVAVSMADAASADGRRDRNSLTAPPLNTADSRAMHHASIGGLYGMSAPWLTGRIQSPL